MLHSDINFFILFEKNKHNIFEIALSKLLEDIRSGKIKLYNSSHKRINKIK